MQQTHSIKALDKATLQNETTAVANIATPKKHATKRLDKDAQSTVDENSQRMQLL